MGRLDKSKTDSIRIEVLRSACDVLKSNQPGLAIKYAKLGIRLADDYMKSNNLLQTREHGKNTKAEFLGFIGLEQMKLDRPDTAIFYFERSYENYESIRNRNGRASSLNSLGIAYSNKGAYDKALGSYFRAVKIKISTKDRRGIAAIYSNIGKVYISLKKPESAFEYFEKSLKLWEELADIYGAAYMYQTIGNLHLAQQEKEKALIHYQKSFNLFLESKKKKWIAGGHSKLGEYFFTIGRADSAQYHYNLAIQMYDAENSENLSIYARMQLSKVMARLKKFDQALSVGKFALALAQKENRVEDMAAVNLTLSEVCTESKDYKGSYEHYVAYSKLKDSSLQIESKKSLAKIQSLYDFESKEKEIMLLNKDKEIQEKEIKKQGVIRNSIIGGFGLVVLFLIVLYNRFKIIKKQKKIIEFEQKRSEELLLNILPQSTATELKKTGVSRPRQYDSVSVLFTDFKGFTQTSEQLAPEALVNELDNYFRNFDDIISKYNIEKIKTIGDAYMCASGLPAENTAHAIDLVKAGLEIRDYVVKKSGENKGQFQIRIGVHSGPVVAGVVGDKKFAYDIWGDTVNMASSMESAGVAGKVNISQDTFDLVKEKFVCTHRGKVEAKNKGEIDMYLVENL